MTKHGAIIPFLLGVITTKIVINYSKKRLVLNFPIDKANTASKIVEVFGGCKYNYFAGTDANRIEYIRVEITSQKSLLKMKKVVHQYKDVLPETNQLMEYVSSLITGKHYNNKPPLTLSTEAKSSLS